MHKEDFKKTLSVVCKILLILFFLILLIIAFFLGMKYQERWVSNINNVDIEKEVTLEDASSVAEMDSKDIESVIEYIASLHIPPGEIEIRENPTETFSFPMYYVDWDTLHYRRAFKDFLSFEVAHNPEGMVFESEMWRYYSVAVGYTILTRGNYYCSLTEPTMFGVGGDTRFGCTRILDLLENRKDVVSEFLFEVLDEADTGCNEDTCPVFEEEAELYLPMYARKLLYFSNDESFKDPTRKNLLDSETQIVEVSENLEKRGFNTTIENYTETEASWSSNLFISTNLLIENEYLKCKYNIAISSHYGKRYMIECKYKEGFLERNQDEINSILDISY
jgi:hypothetical protein